MFNGQEPICPPQGPVTKTSNQSLTVLALLATFQSRELRIYTLETQPPRRVSRRAMLQSGLISITLSPIHVCVRAWHPRCCRGGCAGCELDDTVLE